MEINLIAETLKFLVLGMSTVFMFLVLMVLVLTLQSKIITKFFPHKEEVSIPKRPIAQKGNLAVIAVIAASLQSYKKSK